MCCARALLGLVTAPRAPRAAPRPREASSCWRRAARRGYEVLGTEQRGEPGASASIASARRGCRCVSVVIWTVVQVPAHTGYQDDPRRSRRRPPPSSPRSARGAGSFYSTTRSPTSTRAVADVVDRESAWSQVRFHSMGYCRGSSRTGAPPRRHARHRRRIRAAVGEGRVAVGALEEVAVRDPRRRGQPHGDDGRR